MNSFLLYYDETKITNLSLHEEELKRKLQKTVGGILS